LVDQFGELRFDPIRQRPRLGVLPSRERSRHLSGTIIRAGMRRFIMVGRAIESPRPIPFCVRGGVLINHGRIRGSVIRSESVWRPGGELSGFASWVIAIAPIYVYV